MSSQEKARGVELALDVPNQVSAHAAKPLPGLVDGVRHDGGHHGADETHAHDDHDLLSLAPRGLNELLDPADLGG